VEHLSVENARVLILLPLLLGICFAIPAARRLSVKFRKSTVVVARIVSVSEGTDRPIAERNGRVYYYPCITYRYFQDGSAYVGELKSSHIRRYRIPEIDGFRGKTPESRFAWRGLKSSDEVPVRVFLSNPSDSMPIFPEAPEFVSETWVLVIVSGCFLVLSICMLVLSYRLPGFMPG